MAATYYEHEEKAKDQPCHSLYNTVMQVASRPEQNDIADRPAATFPSIRSHVQQRNSFSFRVCVRPHIAYLMIASALALLSQELSHPTWTVIENLGTDISWLGLVAAFVLSILLPSSESSKAYTMAGGVVFFLCTRFSAAVAEQAVHHSSTVLEERSMHVYYRSVPQTVPWITLGICLGIVSDSAWMLESVSKWENLQRERGVRLKSADKGAIWARHCLGVLSWHMVWKSVMLVMLLCTWDGKYRAYLLGMERNVAAKTLAVDVFLFPRPSLWIMWIAESCRFYNYVVSSSSSY